MAGVLTETRTQDIPDTIAIRYCYSNALRETYRTMRHEYYISLNEFGNEVHINISESRKEVECKYDGKLQKFAN